MRGTFRISRGARTETPTIITEIEQGTAVGRAECVPYPRYGESIDSVLAEIEGLRPALEGGLQRDALQDALPAGAARNAIDCALWDLEAKQTGVSVVDRIGRKIDSAADHVPPPEIHATEGGKARYGIVSIGGAHWAVLEARDELLAEGVDIDYMRVRGFPFSETVRGFLDDHETIFVVEQNRDAQLRMLLTLETDCPKSKLVSVKYYGGQPLSKGHVLDGIRPVLARETAEAAS